MDVSVCLVSDGMSYSRRIGVLEVRHRAIYSPNLLVVECTHYYFIALEDGPMIGASRFRWSTYRLTGTRLARAMADLRSSVPKLGIVGDTPRTLSGSTEHGPGPLHVPL